MGTQQHRTRSCWNTVPDPQWLGAPERAEAIVLTRLKQGEFAGHLLNELGAEPAMSLNELSH